jgi:uncharacterized membrane protein
MVLSLALVGLLTAAGFALANRTAIGRQLGPTILVLLLGLLATNLLGWRLDATAEGLINGPLTSLAIAELLLAVELRRVLPLAGRLLLPFLVSVVAVLLAVVGAGLLLAGWLGDQLAPLAGVYTATFTGGSLNFVAVARTMALPPQQVLVATAADHVVFSLWFVLSLALGRGRQGNGHQDSGRAPGPEDADQASGLALPWRQWRRWLPELPLAFGAGLAVVALSDAMTPLLQRWWPGLPQILVLTTLALLLAQWRPLATNRLSYPLGLVLIHPFFAVVGLNSPVQALLGEGLGALIYAAAIVALQAALVLGLRRWWRWPLVETLVANQAAIGGPSTALAMGVSLGRSDLALPAVAIGLLGYLLGTYLGLVAANLLGLAA